MALFKQHVSNYNGKQHKADDDSITRLQGKTSGRKREVETGS